MLKTDHQSVVSISCESVYHKMYFRCHKLTSSDTGVTHFIGQNVILETIPVTLK